MTKAEFEHLAMRDNTEIGEEMYHSVEYFYMSDNQYHATHGGTEESKQDFVKRVYGGKVNTPKTIAKKTAAESIKENRYCLQGNATATKTRLAQMDSQIMNHYVTMRQYGM